MNKWYVVQVMSSHEKKVKKALEENKDKVGGEFIEEILLPMEKVSEVKQGKRKVLEKRVWPGYLLVKMELNDNSWQYVKDTNGVIAFLGGSKPTALSEHEIQDILKDLASKKDEVVQKHQFEVGDHVKIIDGVFVNFEGTVTDVFHDKGRLSVMVSIFGRQTCVDDLEFWQVEASNNTPKQ